LILHNRKELKSLRKKLRYQLTPAEATLWKLIKGNQLDGRKFRRQQSIGPYILDFYCPEEKIGIELDGESHDNADQSNRDNQREEWLIQQGIRILRFENKSVFESTDSVLGIIQAQFKKKK
jgi:very-short-patch-repair endonuclease